MLFDKNGVNCWEKQIELNDCLGLSYPLKFNQRLNIKFVIIVGLIPS